MFRSFRGIEGASGGIKWLFETENNMCDVRSPGKRRAQKQSNRCELYIFCLSYYFRRHQVRTSGDTMTHFPKRPGHQKASGSIRWLQHQGFEAENASPGKRRASKAIESLRCVHFSWIILCSRASCRDIMGIGTQFSEASGASGASAGIRWLQNPRFEAENSMRDARSP